MFTTKFGTRNLNHKYLATELASTLTNPALGQLVVLKAAPDEAMSFAPSESPKEKSGKRSKKPTLRELPATIRANLVPDPDAGKLQLAGADDVSSGEIDGIIVQINRKTGGTLDSIVVAPPGEEVPLSLFGTLSALQALGAGNILYLSQTTKGAVQGGALTSGATVRRVARLPKFLSNLTASDIDPTNPDAIYVALIEDRPTQT